MGINPLNVYKNFSQNSISDHGTELQRQLDVRKAQLEKLSSKDVLSSEQLARKKDLEQTVSMLEGKLNRHLGNSSDSFHSSKAKVNESKSSLSANAPADSLTSQNYAEGTVISKSSYPTTPYAGTQASNNYLKGFFFDARI